MSNILKWEVEQSPCIFHYNVLLLLNVLTHEKVNDENVESGRIYNTHKWRDDCKETIFSDFNEQYEEKKDSSLGKIQETIDEGLNEIVIMYQNAAEGMKVKMKTKYDHKKKPW